MGEHQKGPLNVDPSPVFLPGCLDCGSIEDKAVSGRVLELGAALSVAGRLDEERGVEE